MHIRTDGRIYTSSVGSRCVWAGTQHRSEIMGRRDRDGHAVTPREEGRRDEIARETKKKKKKRRRKEQERERDRESKGRKEGRNSQFISGHATDKRWETSEHASSRPPADAPPPSEPLRKLQASPCCFAHFLLHHPPHPPSGG